mgnify:CR=1 FL=1
MNNLFSVDSPILVFIGKIMDILWVSILWLVCCIPILTIGASTTAFYAVMLQIDQNRDSLITKTFFRVFAENFRQSTIIWLLNLIVVFLFYINFRFYSQQNGEFRKLFLVVESVFLFFYILGLQYVFPVLAVFKNSIKNIVGFSFILSIKNLGWSVLLLIISIAVFAFTYFIIKELFLFSFGIIVFLHSKILARIFSYYIDLVTQKKND